MPIFSRRCQGIDQGRDRAACGIGMKQGHGTAQQPLRQEGIPDDIIIQAQVQASAQASMVSNSWQGWRHGCICLSMAASTEGVQGKDRPELVSSLF